MTRTSTDPFSFIGDYAKAVGQELARADREFRSDFGKDLDRVISTTKQQGILQGGVELVDAFSTGNLTMRTGDALNLIPEDPALQQMIAGGINLATNNPIALKDAFDAIGALTTASPGAIAGMPRAPQTPVSPEQAKERAIERAKERAKERIHDKVEHAEEHAQLERLLDRLGERDGYGCDCVGDGLDRSLDELVKRLRDLCGEDKTGRAGDEIDRLLRDPNLCFEDLVFLLMRRAIRDGQDEAEGLARGLKDGRASDRDAQRKLYADAAELRSDYAAATDPAKRERLANELQKLNGEGQLKVDERMESRAERAEELKRALQKLSEMEQALSNVLNTQHETAMSTIRNIR